MTTTAVFGAWIGINNPINLDDPNLFAYLHYIREGYDTTYWKTNGYSYVGKATITLEPIIKNEMIAAKAEAIKADSQGDMGFQPATLPHGQTIELGNPIVNEVPPDLTFNRIK